MPAESGAGIGLHLYHGGHKGHREERTGALRQTRTQPQPITPFPVGQQVPDGLFLWPPFLEFCRRRWLVWNRRGV